MTRLVRPLSRACLIRPAESATFELRTSTLTTTAFIEPVALAIVLLSLGLQSTPTTPATAMTAAAVSITDREETILDAHEAQRARTLKVLRPVINL